MNARSPCGCLVVPPRLTRFVLEVFAFTWPDGRVQHFNVDAAIEIATQRNLPVNTFADCAQLVASTAPDSLVQSHLDHVDPAQPGLGVVIDDDRTCIIIDGHHRAARQLRDRGPGACVPIIALPHEYFNRLTLDPEIVAHLFPLMPNGASW